MQTKINNALKPQKKNFAKRIYFFISKTMSKGTGHYVYAIMYFYGAKTSLIVLCFS